MTDPRYLSYRSTRVFASLDGLRGLSILAVLAHHSAGQLDWLPMSRHERGFLGVDFFFVISGFLIVTLLLREREASGGISLPKFYIRRSLRILPLYYAMLLITTAICGVWKSGTDISRGFWQDVPFLASHTSNLVVLQVMTPLFVAWSLATEEQFYLVWPAVEKWLSGRAVWLPIIGLLAASQVVNFRLANGVLGAVFGPQWPGLLILQITLTPILFGVVLAHALQAPAMYRVLWRLVGFPGASVFWAGMLVVAINLPGEDIQGVVRLAIQSLMALFLASCVIREDHWLNGLLRFVPLARIGVVSYGIYLFHMFLLPLGNSMLATAGIDRPEERFAVTLGLSWLVAENSYRVFERRILKWKDRHTPKRDIVMSNSGK